MLNWRMGLALALTLATWGQGVRAETVADKPRLAVVLEGSAPGFAGQLQSRLQAMRRFMVVDKSAFRARFGAAGIAAGGHPTVAQSRSMRGASGADIVLAGSIKQDGRSIRVVCRLFDLRTGEFSRDLTLFGESSATAGLVTQLAGFVRQSAPLQCLVRDMSEDQVIIGLGETDGVTVGSTFQVLRHPANIAPFKVGVLKVVAVQPFAARAEMEETVKGMSVAAGDMLVERTADMLMK